MGVCTVAVSAEFALVRMGAEAMVFGALELELAVEVVVDLLGDVGVGVAAAIVVVVVVVVVVVEDVAVSAVAMIVDEVIAVAGLEL